VNFSDGLIIPQHEKIDYSAICEASFCALVATIELSHSLCQPRKFELDDVENWLMQKQLHIE
jgi:hypothetical protein